MRRRTSPFITGLALAVFSTICIVSSPRASAAPTASPSTPEAVSAYAQVLHTFNPQLPDWQSRDLARHLLANARRWKLDANLLTALVSVESSWRTHARSRVGAIGLGQLMPGTASMLGVNPRNTYQNLSGAARYLSGLLTHFQSKPNHYVLAFAAYNAGPKAVERFGGVPPYYETQRYVIKVMTAWQSIRQVVHIPKHVLLAHHKSLDSSNGDVAYWTGR